MSAAQVVAPVTQFGEAGEAGADMPISSVDWEKVVLHEPTHVGTWLIYLHCHEHCREVE